MAAKKRVIVAAFAALLILFGAALQAAVSSFTGPLSDLPIYVGAPQPYSYILDTNTTHYFAFNGTTGYNTLTSTNASEVLESANIVNGSIEMRAGTYILQTHLTIANMSQIVGRFGSTVIDVGTSGAWFKFDGGGYKDVLLRDLVFDGKGASNVKAIDSSGLSGSSQVLDKCNLENIHIRNFDGSGSLPLDLKNFERGSISGFETWGLMSDAGRIKLTTDANAGNVRIYDFFMSGAGQNDVPMIYTEQGALHIFDGQFHSLNTHRGLALYANTSSVNVDRLWMHDCRGEYCSMVWATTDGTILMRGGDFHDNNFRDDDASAIGVSLAGNISRWKVHHNVFDFVNGVAYNDTEVVDTAVNQLDECNAFTENTLVDSICDFNTRTYVKDNHGYEIGYITNWRIDTTKVGRGTSATMPSSPVTLTAYGGDFYINVTGGTGVTIAIKAYDATLIQDVGASYAGWLYAGMKININYTGAPTIRLYQRG